MGRCRSIWSSASPSFERDVSISFCSALRAAFAASSTRAAFSAVSLEDRVTVSAASVVLFASPVVAVSIRSTLLRTGPVVKRLSILTPFRRPKLTPLEGSWPGAA
jgi:hypothetical protein